MDEASLRREGNCRFASIRLPGWPEDPRALGLLVREALSGQSGVEAIGPISLLFDLPPGDEAPTTWACQIGTALTGLAEGSTIADRDQQLDMVVEDYRQLNALHRPHYESLASLGETVQGLRDEARARGWQVRPYWRLALWQRETSDGNTYPEPEVAVFVDP